MISQKKAIYSKDWIVVAVAFLVMLGFRGTTGSFGVFLKPIMAALRTTRGSTSGAMSIFMMLNGLVGIVAGWLTDRYGARVVIAGGAVLAFLGYTLAYQISALWELYLYFGIIVGTSMGACFVPVNATVSKRFTDKRVLAVGITNSGVAIGQMTIPLLAAYSIDGLGWKPAFILMGGIILIASLPAMIWLRSKPPGRSNAPAGNEATAALAQKMWTTGKVLRTVQFWMFIIIGFVTATGFYFVLVHVVPYATDMGITATSAALILTVFNAGTVTAQILIWFLAKKIGSRFTIIIMLCLQALALFLLMEVGSFPMLIILVVVFGFGFGGSNTIRISMIPEVFGTRSGGEILGIISMAWAVGGVTGPILAGYIFDLSQSYSAAFLTAGILLAIGAASGFFLRVKEGMNY